MLLVFELSANDTRTDRRSRRQWSGPRIYRPGSLMLISSTFEAIPIHHPSANQSHHSLPPILPFAYPNIPYPLQPYLLPAEKNNIRKSPKVPNRASPSHNPPTAPPRTPRPRSPHSIPKPPPHPNHNHPPSFLKLQNPTYTPNHPPLKPKPKPEITPRHTTQHTQNPPSRAPPKLTNSKKKKQPPRSLDLSINRDGKASGPAIQETVWTYC